MDPSIEFQQPSHKQYLDIPMMFTTEYAFQEVEIGGLIGDLIKGAARPEEITGGKVDPIILSIFDQLQRQQIECKTSICVEEGKTFLQTVPSIGTIDSVSNSANKGVKHLEVHNHPPLISADGSRQTYEYFSSQDLIQTTYPKSTNPIEIVVFEGGTVFLIKTEETKRILAAEKERLQVKGRYHWSLSANDFAERYDVQDLESTNDKRKAMNVQFAKEYGMKLLFVQPGSDEIQVIV